jgi:hypothetical protein
MKKDPNAAFTPKMLSYVQDVIIPGLLRYTWPFYHPSGSTRIRRSKPDVGAPFPPQVATYAPLPMHVLLSKYLTPAAKEVFALLCYHAGEKSWAYPSIESLAQRTGLAISAVEEAICILERYKYLRRVQTPEQLQQLAWLIDEYYKNDPKGGENEKARLFKRPEGRKQRVNYYLLLWNDYADMAWRWQALTENYRADHPYGIGLIAQLVRGIPEDNTAARGPRVKRPYVKKVKPVQKAPAAPREAAAHPAGEEETRSTGPHPDRDAVLEFWQRRHRELFPYKKVVTDAERQAVNSLLNQMDKQKRRSTSRERIEALIGWYLQWCHRGAPKLGLSTPAVGALVRPNLVEACSDWAITECGVALWLLQGGTIRTARGTLPGNPQEHAEVEQKVAKALKKSGMDSLRPTAVILDYLDRAPLVETR